MHCLAEACSRPRLAACMDPHTHTCLYIYLHISCGILLGSVVVVSDPSRLKQRTALTAYIRAQYTHAHINNDTILSQQQDNIHEAVCVHVDRVCMQAVRMCA